ncbi:MAG TPA: adenosylcobinamide amidohydrolase [Bryobacteraceae bacterium]|nr:adenosylcobinamide amidohydrolase [Bryobacteraceae bacterium]
MTPSVKLNWEVLRNGSHFVLRRAGRYVVAELAGPHLILSTSARNGGQTRGLRYVGNHQSCEGAAHIERQNLIHQLGQVGYHDLVCSEIGLRADEVALMGTAANMNCVALANESDFGLEVTAAVTAGVQGNAACAGDPAGWREGESGWEKIGGTINTMLFINRPLTEAAMARAVVTMTEAKSTALQRLAVRSLYSSDMATGTGTDQFAIAAPETAGYPLTSTSPHVKLGELIGRTVRDATLEALRWQNGLEASYTRSIFSALGRFGLREESFFDEIAPLLTESSLLLMRKNSKAVFYEPHVAAAAYAFAAVMDRIRYDTLPQNAANAVLRQQAASMAVSLSAKPQLWEQFHAALAEQDPVRLVLHALAIGWIAKWQS